MHFFPAKKIELKNVVKNTFAPSDQLASTNIGLCKRSTYPLMELEVETPQTLLNSDSSEDLT